MGDKGIGPGGIKKLSIVVMKVRNWEAMVAWYVDVLGLSIKYREDHDRWCQLMFPDEGGAQLALYGIADQDVREGANRCVPDIEVEDLNSALEALRVRGVTVQGGVRGGEEGFRIATIVDPEGNELQLYQWVS